MSMNTTDKNKFKEIAEYHTDKRYMTLTEIAEYLTLGRSRADSFCKIIGAKRKIGKRAIYDRQRIDDYFSGEDCFRFPEESND